MTRPLDFEDFAKTPADRAAQVQAEADTIRQSAYEMGYKSGWEDCAATAEAESATIGADLAQSLRELSFTYEEARQDVIAGLRPLLEGIASQLLPRLAAEAVLPILDAEIATILAQRGVMQIEIMVAPDLCPAIARLVERHVDVPLSVKPEPAFGPGRVALHFAGEEQEINLDTAAALIAQALRDFIEQPPQMGAPFAPMAQDQRPSGEAA